MIDGPRKEGTYKMDLRWPPGQREQHAGVTRPQAWKGPWPVGHPGFMGIGAGVFDQPTPGRWR